MAITKKAVTDAQSKAQTVGIERRLAALEANRRRQGLGSGGAASSGNATSIQGVGVSATAPTDGQALEYDAASGLYEPTTPSDGGMANPMTAAGDLIVGGSASGGVAAPTRLAAGTAGQVLTSNGPGAAPSYQAAGGGGGTGSLLMLFPTLFGAPVPTITSTGLSTAYNQKSTFTAANGVQGIVFSETVFTKAGWCEGLLKAYPSTPFTLTAVFSFPLGMSSDNISLVIVDTLTGKLMSIGVQPGSGGILAVNWNTPTSFSSVTATAAVGNCPIIGIRIVDDGTNITFYASGDGNSWNQIYTVAKASSWLGSTGFNYIGATISAETKQLSSVLLYWNGA